jgi:acetyl esterase/lipase
MPDNGPTPAPTTTASIGEPVQLPVADPVLADRRPVRREYVSDIFQTAVVTNVSTPTLTPVLPADGCGAAVVVAPGGAFHGLSIQSEGFQVATWLAERGVAAFVLEYRLVPGGDDSILDLIGKPAEQLEADVATIAPLAAADGHAALRWVREHAADLGVDPGRVGIIGFSAGGAVALATVTAADPRSRPDLTGAIYAVWRPEDRAPLPQGTGPLFALAASDDALGLAPHAVELHRTWTDAGLSAELHLYAQGNHGFGMRVQGLPSDRWIERWWDWLGGQGFLLSR